LSLQLGIFSFCGVDMPDAGIHGTLIPKPHTVLVDIWQRVASQA
jgi:hypothetical protein